MSFKIKKQYKNKYTVIDNKILQDNRLSYMSVGIFIYLWSMPDDWEINVKQLMKRNDTSEYKTRQALRELRDYGYIKWTRESGNVLYELNDCGDFINDLSEKEEAAELKKCNTSNKDLKEKTYKKETSPPSTIQKNGIVQEEDNNFQEVYKEYNNLDELKSISLKSKKYQDLQKKYKKALKKFDKQEILKGIKDYKFYLDIVRKSGFNQQQKGFEVFLNQEGWLGYDGKTWTEKTKEYIENLKQSQENKQELKKYLKEKIDEQLPDGITEEMIEGGILF